MIKPSALILAAAMAAVSTGTYFGLEMLPEGALPEPIGRAPQAAPPDPGVKPQQQEVASAAAAAPAPAPEAAPADQPVTEQDLAEDPPPVTATPEPPAEPAIQARAAPAPESETVPAAEESAPEPAQPAAKPYTPPPALVDEPTPAKTKPTVAPKKQVTVVREASEPTQTASAEAPKASKPKPPDADVIKPWWPDSSKVPANQLKLQYAGQVQGEQAIALLFSAPLNLETVKQHAQIKTQTGQAVQGGWELGKNPRLAVFRGVQAGRYTVILAPQIADAKGFMLGQKLQGPVYIQSPQAQ